MNAIRLRCLLLNDKRRTSVENFPVIFLEAFRHFYREDIVVSSTDDIGPFEAVYRDELHNSAWNQTCRN